MDWKQVWIDVFGATEWLGLDMGFWVALVAIALAVVVFIVSNC